MALTVNNDLKITDGTLNGYSAFTGGKIATDAADAASGLKDVLASADFSDPGTLIKVQAQMATYQTSIGVISSMVKSFEDTLKGITQKM